MISPVETRYNPRVSSDSINLRSSEDIRLLLEPIHFADKSAAHATLYRLVTRYGDPFADILHLLLAALETAADPDRSLVNFERFAENYGPPLFTQLTRNTRVIEILVILFSTSQFLTEILLRNPKTLSLLVQRKALTQRKTIDQFQSEAEASVNTFRTYKEKLGALRLYQRGELLRIGTCDFLDLFDLKSVVSQLSRLANGLIRACLSLASQETDISPKKIVVIAMGKLGGRELNYSSDIDLLFVTRKDVEATIQLTKKFIEIIGKPTPEGFLYRIDVRLRPWGKDGPLVSTTDSYLKYIQEHARLWEKQAMLKARSIAGDIPLGENLLERVRPLLYNTSPEEVRARVFAMKQRTEQYLQQKGRDWGEVKLGVGSIRDIEFVVQSMQLIHGSALLQIRTRATLKGISLLRAARLITQADGNILNDGYIFLRTIEHYLQMLDYRQTNTLPSDSTAIVLLARRLGFEGPQSGEHFLTRYQQHCDAIRLVFLRYLGSDTSHEGITSSMKIVEEHLVQQHLARMDASYTEVFSPLEIQHHAKLVDQLNDETLAIVELTPHEHGQWRFTIVAHDYPGELSIICGLMFIYGMNIIDGYAFTYEPFEEQPSTRSSLRTAKHRHRLGRHPSLTSSDGLPRFKNHRKIVDVFTVKPVRSELPNLRERYSEDLIKLLKRMRTGQRREARGELAKRVGAAFHDIPAATTPLLPIDIEIDNDVSSRYTVMHIDALDTIGFLYELTNALAFYRIYIARVLVQSVGRRVQDTLYVTDSNGQKIINPERQRELRAAIVLIKNFTHLLPRSPNPESALLHFREFIAKLFQHPNWPNELASFERSDVLSALARLLGVSDFLWDDFLRMQYANLFPIIQDMNALSTAKPHEQLEEELTYAIESLTIGNLEYEDWRAALNAFKDRELFRIDMRHILGLTAEFWEFSAELTDLAEIVIQTTLKHCEHELQSPHGVPLLENGSPCPLTVFALGKFGGRELGFASDIELMFVYGGAGTTSGLKKISTAEYFERLVQCVVSAIQTRLQGTFQIDLQLRPYGKTGSMAVALDSFQRYYTPDGPAWAYERQALVKLRPMAGDEALGVYISKLRDEFVYSGEPFDATAMRAMRERQVRHLVTGGTFNAKYSPGGLVDLEYLIQGLQITHGAANLALRLTNIREAMVALAEAGILSANDYTRLHKAHTFLRWLIDSLRVVRGNAKDNTVPSASSEEFAFLARRLHYGSNTSRLLEELSRYAGDVQEISARLL